MYLAFRLLLLVELVVLYWMLYDGSYCIRFVDVFILGCLLEYVRSGGLLI